jgi:copper chaperone
MKQVFIVTGMTCGHCEQSVTRALKAVDPSAIVQIDRNLNRVEVDSGAQRETLQHAVEEEGYEVAAAA